LKPLKWLTAAAFSLELTCLEPLDPLDKV